ncbi:hypothetical protein HPP92_002956 [Vanilla planifolia]|uniref:H15 domain-containing protein n=1 Tax=Vanilla planifolia TaxID=51239 RepID=A0A835VJF2_VANPL|nr:hypothetical protein HPP92_002956 [Vanilla planifolia]
MEASLMSPRRRTPDHPPYATMIREAIESMAEPCGVTPSSISNYIMSNFAGLPSAHERLFPYLLKKLTDMGEFLEVFPGRFLISKFAGKGAISLPFQPAFSHFAQHHVDEPNLAARRRGRPRKLRHEDQRTAIVCCLISEEAKRSVAKRRGRPRKGDQEGALAVFLFPEETLVTRAVQRPKKKRQKLELAMIEANPQGRAPRGRAAKKRMKLSDGSTGSSMVTYRRRGGDPKSG